MNNAKQSRSRLPYLAVSFGLGLASISCSPYPELFFKYLSANTLETRATGFSMSCNSS